jgi:hypothetical protein
MYDDGDDVVVGVDVHMTWRTQVNGGRCRENENEAGVQCGLGVFSAREKLQCSHQLPASLVRDMAWHDRRES